MIWPPPRKPLEGKIVRMEPLAEDHFDGLEATADDPRIWTWMDRRIPSEEGAFQSWFDARLLMGEHGDEWCFATVSAASGEPLGSSSYLAARPEHDGLEIGWTWLNSSVWRSGANREAKLLMLRFAFAELGCMRVEFKTDARNERSREALTALGATHEGTFRKHMRMPAGQGIRDSAYFSITDTDWPEIEAALERRLNSCGGQGTHKGSIAELGGLAGA